MTTHARFHGHFEITSNKKFVFRDEGIRPNRGLTANFHNSQLNVLKKEPHEGAKKCLSLYISGKQVFIIDEYSDKSVFVGLSRH